MPGRCRILRRSVAPRRPRDGNTHAWARCSGGPGPRAFPPWRRLLAPFAPAGTAREVVARLNAELKRVFAPPGVAAKLKTLGLEPWISTPAELARFRAAEITKWATW